MVVRK